MPNGRASRTYRVYIATMGLKNFTNHGATSSCEEGSFRSPLADSQKGKGGQDEIRKDYLKSYGKKWRAKNQDKVRKSLYEYWRRRLAREAGVENL